MFSKPDIERYFVAEKKGGSLIIFISVIAIVAALTLVFVLNTSFHRGIAIPMTGIGIIFLVAGFVVYRRSDGDRKRLVYAFDMNPSELQTEKLRMEKVMKQFVFLKYIEIFLFLLGATLFVLFMKNERNDFWQGLGLGLAFMAFIALLFDNYAERRGRRYLDGLTGFLKKPGV